jgi:8-oxo-dGTP pyrophosphatase MutT (NUDIX family)
VIPVAFAVVVYRSVAAFGRGAPRIEPPDFAELRVMPAPRFIPIGRVDVGETIEQAAIREVEEEIGVKAEIVEYIGEGIGNYSITHFFLMHHTGEVVLDFNGDETAEVLFVTWQEAIRLFEDDGNKRDVEIALKAMKMLRVE